MGDAIAFRGDVITLPLDQVTLRCRGCGRNAVVKNPRSDTNYRACNCGSGQELIDYRATDPDGRVIRPRWGELPKPWGDD